MIPDLPQMRGEATERAEQFVQAVREHRAKCGSKIESEDYARKLRIGAKCRCGERFSISVFDLRFLPEKNGLCQAMRTRIGRDAVYNQVEGAKPLLGKADV